jgi:hypothetical protein
MHVIWKRPDGFQNAVPEDFKRAALSNGAQLWLHRSETDWYPFQVSGDWTGQEQTKRLNKLVNLLDAPESAWVRFLEHYYDDEIGDNNVSAAVKGISTWVDELKTHIRGNTWETEIINCALNDIKERISKLS